MYLRSETIAAVATARGSAALGIVRISGPAAASVVEKVMPATSVSSKPRRLVAGTARHPKTGSPIDKSLCFYCPGPGTATGEDTAEIHGHGGPLVMKRLLEAVVEAGARPAEPGEFTYRAYRNGRMDLTQAEAVMGLISARSDRAAQLALRQLNGGLGKALEQELDELTAVAAQIEAALDFPDEDLPVTQAAELSLRLEKLAGRLATLRDSFGLGARLTRGAIAAIVGAPNAGKSSLFNRLVREDRALVDEAPGTTRDVIEAPGEIDGIPVVYSDTAGLRAGGGRLEKQGMERTITAAGKADLVLLVVDGAAQREEALSGIEGYLERWTTEGADGLVVAVNKSDLPGWSDAIVASLLPDGTSIVPVSALTGKGVDPLKQAMGQVLATEYGDGMSILTTQRQHTAVSVCHDHVTQACQRLRTGADLELAAADLRWALDQLAALWGRDPVDDVIETLFSTFCIGK